jgi:hypothetical protein
VVVENLRQLCIFKIAKESKRPWVWWDYVTDFHIRCPMKEKKYNKQCAGEVIKSLGWFLDFFFPKVMILYKPSTFVPMPVLQNGMCTLVHEKSLHVTTESWDVSICNLGSYFIDVLFVSLFVSSFICKGEIIWAIYKAERQGMCSENTFNLSYIFC